MRRTHAGGSPVCVSYGMLGVASPGYAKLHCGRRSATDLDRMAQTLGLLSRSHLGDTASAAVQCRERALSLGAQGLFKFYDRQKRPTCFNVGHGCFRSDVLPSFGGSAAGSAADIPRHRRYLTRLSRLPISSSVEARHTVIYTTSRWAIVNTIPSSRGIGRRRSYLWELFRAGRRNGPIRMGHTMVIRSGEEPIRYTCQRPLVTCPSDSGALSHQSR